MKLYKLIVLKKYIMAIFVFLLMSCSSSSNKNNAAIQFNQNYFDFGTIEFNSNAEKSFEFSNPGKVPLIIYDVKTSCGCTSTDWPKEPIKAGSTSQIKINYNTSTLGHFDKTIIVFFNGPDSPILLLIKGNVVVNNKLQKKKYPIK